MEVMLHMPRSTPLWELAQGSDRCVENHPFSSVSLSQNLWGKRWTSGPSFHPYYTKWSLQISAFWGRIDKVCKSPALNAMMDHLCHDKNGKGERLTNVIPPKASCGHELSDWLWGRDTVESARGISGAHHKNPNIEVSVVRKKLSMWNLDTSQRVEITSQAVCDTWLEVHWFLPYLKDGLQDLYTTAELPTGTNFHEAVQRVREEWFMEIMRVPLQNPCKDSRIYIRFMKAVEQAIVLLKNHRDFADDSELGGINAIAIFRGNGILKLKIYAQPLSGENLFLPHHWIGK